LHVHPDKRGGNREDFNAVSAAFDTLLQALPAEGVAPGSATHASHFQCGGSSSSGGVQAPASGSWAAPAAAWDPWGAAPAFDPWSSGTEGWGGQSVGTPAICVSDAVSRTATAFEAIQAPRKKRKKRKGPTEVDEERNLMRGGVYGFRVDSSSESEEAAPRPAFAPAPAPAAAPALALAAAPAATVESTCLVVRLPMPPLAASLKQPKRGRREQAQRRCAIHNRLRFGNFLIEDEDGNFVCKPGAECP